jgi:hypothetical protein
MFGTRLSFWLLVTAPVAALLHVFFSLILLQRHVESISAYALGDLLIACLWICSFVFFHKKIKAQHFGTDPAASTRAECLERIFVSIALALCIFALWSVRLNYSGPAYDGVTISDIAHEKIALPIFSDEWLYAGFARKAAERHELPLFSPFGDGVSQSSQGNFLAPYVGGLAGFMLSSRIDIVDQYHIYVFAFHLVFVLMLYAFFRSFGLRRFLAIFGLILFICLPESNLAPGIWIMLPAYVGLIFVFGALILMNLNTYVLMLRKWRIIGICANGILASLIYPPYLILAAIAFAFRHIKSPKKIITLFVIMAAASLIIAKLAGSGISIKTAWDMSVRDRVGAATESIWAFIPIVFSLMAIAGLYIALVREDLEIFQKKLLLFGTFILGMIIACTYLFDKEIILSHQRAVFMLWILMIVMVCFFVDFIIGKIKKTRHAQVSIVLLSICIILLAYGSIFGMYQRIPPWEGITANVDVLIGPVPSRPIMLSMLPTGFEKILENKKGRFIADPYISLAIGATTNLQPISASPSFITITGPTLADFKHIKTCDEKARFAEKNSISHVVMYASEDVLAPCSEFKFSGKLGKHYFIYDRI